jgi:ABC-type antimicrobial peptide transport system permease subunit
MVLRQALALATGGILIGTAASVALTRLLRGVLFEVDTLDPMSFAAAILVLVGAALAAGLVPAWRASRQDPVSTLRA